MCRKILEPTTKTEKYLVTDYSQDQRLPRTLSESDNPRAVYMTRNRSDSIIGTVNCGNVCTIVNKMIEREENWKSMTAFCESVMLQKENAEREREAFRRVHGKSMTTELIGVGDQVDGAKYQTLICPEFLDEAESTSICPLLTPSPSNANMLCTSPDGLPDPESASICPLLEQSPPADIFRHPLDPLAGLAYEPRGIDTELPSYVGLTETRDSRSSSLPGVNDENFVIKRGSVVNGLLESSSSSSSSALQDNPSCVQLLSHRYSHLSTDKKDTFIPQENGAAGCLELSGHKMAADHSFVHWNWPIIRTSCLWIVISITVACMCVVVGMVATVPRVCLPHHEWYQGGVFYEVFPASFQDSGHDGLGDIRGVASRTEYFLKLGITAVRLNSIFPTSDYPESLHEIKNLTAVDQHLGTISDIKYLITVLHSSNISLILDLPIFPLVKNLGELKIPPGKIDGTIRKENIAEKITNVVHNHRSHREVNKTEGSPARFLAEAKSELEGNKAMLTPYIDGGISGLMKVTSEHIKTISQTVVAEALNFWFDLGVDGIYIKGLENYIYDQNFLTELKSWNKLKQSYQNKKMLMTSYKVLDEAENDQKMDVLSTFELLDVFLEVSNGSQYIADEVSKYLNSPIFKDKSYPWIHWNIGNMDTKRLSSRVASNLGAIVFQNLLPGTMSIFYGDEIALTESHDPHGDRKELREWHQLSPMIWVNDNTGFTPSTIIPWLPYGTADHESVSQIIRNLTQLRRTTPSIYMNKVWKDNEIILNTAIRFADDSIVIIERSYPRRNIFVSFYNYDIKDVERDVTNIYYGGEVVQDSEGNSGNYVTFKKFTIRAGAATIIKLDK